MAFRLILLILAGGVGLWLGAGSRTAAAAKPPVRRADPAKSLTADEFRFDILLSRSQPATPPLAPAASPAPPAAVVVAHTEPVPVVQATVQAALDLPGPARRQLRHPLGPRARPAGALQIRVEGRVAPLEVTDEHVQAILTALPAMQTALRRQLDAQVQCELARFAKQLDAIKADLPPCPPRM
ncbi:MAG: hypothetical protein ACLQBJ_07185 [Bryobacteraceae bacterium]